jgi:hypothetical protein
VVHSVRPLVSASLLARRLHSKVYSLALKSALKLIVLKVSRKLKKHENPYGIRVFWQRSGHRGGDAEGARTLDLCRTFYRLTQSVSEWGSTVARDSHVNLKTGYLPNDHDADIPSAFPCARRVRETALRPLPTYPGPSPPVYAASAASMFFCESYLLVP